MRRIKLTTNEIIGNNIHEKRTSLDMPQMELAKLVGFKSQNKLSYIEAGKRKCAIVDLLKIANCLDCSVEELLRGLLPNDPPQDLI